MDLDFGDYFQFIFALIFVLALIAILAAVARRMGFGYRTPTRGRSKRLGIVEILPVDAKRRLALFRRDGVEHLVLLGFGSGPDLIIEQGIPAPDGDFAGALADAASADARPESEVRP